eukprot:363605-Chlamydomonas_euryale.AAC.8
METYVNWVFRLGGVDDGGAVILTEIPVILTLYVNRLLREIGIDCGDRASPIVAVAKSPRRA